MWEPIFFINSALLGFGLAMDAFSVSLANGLNDPYMKRKKIFGIAGLFAFFQALMPMIGWICIHTILNQFSILERFIPWIALILLLYIGIKMLCEGIKGCDDQKDEHSLTFGALLLQGIATSIDALSVGFTIAEYDKLMALACAGIIALVTFLICLAGVFIGKKIGTRLAGKASIFGGVILIIIGLEIFIKSFIG